MTMLAEKYQVGEQTVGLRDVKESVVFPEVQSTENKLGGPCRIVVADTGVSATLVPPNLRPKCLYIPWSDQSGYANEPIGQVHGSFVKMIQCEGFNSPLRRKDVDLMSFQCLDRNGSGGADPIAAALRFARDRKAHILNMSLGVHFKNPTERRAIQRWMKLVEEDGWLAYMPAGNLQTEDWKGTLIFVAAGNEDTLNDWRSDDIDFPAIYQWAVAVGATDEAGAKSYFSGDGDDLEFVARGENFYRIKGMSGTSFASPLSSMVAAYLITYVFGALPPWEVRKLLRLVAVHGGTEPHDPWCRDHGYGSLTPIAWEILRVLAGERKAAGYVDGNLPFTIAA